MSFPVLGGLKSPSVLAIYLGEGLGVKETPQQKYQRLLHEVQELTAEVEKIKVTIDSHLASLL